jgi:hypothetical protein
MPIQPFTPAGVASKTTELYALDDSDLLAEVRTLNADILAWLETNFTLSARQKNYISDAPDNVKFSWSSILSAALIQRADIEMKPVPTDYGPPRRTKEIQIGINGNGNYAPPVTGVGTITGSMVVLIDYVLID